jgi:membrane fusion protein, heavy metal efflux system
MSEMSRAPTSPQPPNRASFVVFWRQLGKRPWIAVVGVVLVFLLWTFTRNGDRVGRTEAESANADEKQARVDTVVTIDSAAQRFIGIALAAATGASAEVLVANGTITYDANRASVVAPRAEGRLLSVRADLGQGVTAGSILAVLESPEVGQTQGEWERARAALQLARQNYEREQRLFAQSISSRKDLLEAESAFRSAQADSNSAAARLRAFGAATDASGTFHLVAPIAGTVVERNAMPGQIAGPSTILFTIADMRRLWITVDVYEMDAPRVRTGARVWVMPRAMPGERFAGRVSFAGAIVDTLSRTVKMRVDIDNPNLRLKPGMFAQVQFDVPESKRGVIVVPASAVQDLNGKRVVFVPGAVSGQFVTREVSVGLRRPGDMVAVISGIQLGELVVTRGAFQLKSELLKASFGDDEK